MNWNAAVDEMLGNFAVTGTNFDPAIILGTGTGLRTRFSRMRRNVYGSRDLFAPSRIAQEMLPKFLPRHAKECIARMQKQWHCAWRDPENLLYWPA